MSAVVPGPERPLALWGGVECSVVRVGDIWRDQLRDTGHQDRGTEDLVRLAQLGLRTLRYPLVWERQDPASPESLCWHDRQVASLQDLGIDVIAGLVHHGSGPARTSLLDPLFPEKLALHASAMARRYPGVRRWIPVNEPLTTARFSCLYGHWYPHLHDEGAFLRAVANQCRATLLAMRAIRTATSGALFLSTEDIGRVFSTAGLAEQARYENDRRWLSLDLICGKVTHEHPWRGYLEGHGVPAAHLDELATGEASPDVIGVNHYATSDRFLDHRLDRYSAQLRGGNGRIEYVDTEAIRAGVAQGRLGWLPRLREVWARYGRPMALTEVHLGCADPVESVRWLMEAWDAARAIRAEGARCVGVTAWALFGLIDWDSLLREQHGRAEPGAFDIRFRPPRPTLIAEAVHALAHEAQFVHPALKHPGWWRRADRVHEGLRAPQAA